MNYQMRIQCVTDELKRCTKEDTVIRVKNLLSLIKQGDEKLKKHDERMKELGVRTNAPTSVMEDWAPEHLILVIERERIIKKIRVLRCKIIQHLGGHDYYIAALSLFGDGRDYSWRK